MKKAEKKRQSAVLRAVRGGNTIATAARAAAIARSTLYEWLKDPAFGEALEKAKASAEARDVALIARAARRNWKAAAWALERRNPRDWGLRIQVEVRKQIDDFLSYMEQSLPPEIFETVRITALSYELSDDVSELEFERGRQQRPTTGALN